jgi:hypothetical protein
MAAATPKALIELRETEPQMNTDEHSSRTHSAWGTSPSSSAMRFEAAPERPEPICVHLCSSVALSFFRRLEMTGLPEQTVARDAAWH